MKDRRLDVFMVRHAVTEEDQGLGDAARALTPAGRKAFRAHARKLADRIAVDGILTSPAVRAVQTAEILAVACAVDRVVVRAELGADTASAESVAGVLSEMKGAWAVVGHNPSLPAALAHLLDREMNLKKGAIAALRREEGDWKLRWSAAPGQKPRRDRSG